MRLSEDIDSLARTWSQIEQDLKRDQISKLIEWIITQSSASDYLVVVTGQRPGVDCFACCHAQLGGYSACNEHIIKLTVGQLRGIDCVDCIAAMADGKSGCERCKT